MIDLFKDDEATKDRSNLVQNCLPTRAPDFCTTPFWYVCGNEKKVKVGRESFNYIDYLEAWHGMDCGTYRSRDSLDKIYLRIRDAYASIENVEK